LKGGFGSSLFPIRSGVRTSSCCSYRSLSLVGEMNSKEGTSMKMKNAEEDAHQIELSCRGLTHVGRDEVIYTL
jgi:hypothetical protein